MRPRDVPVKSWLKHLEANIEPFAAADLDFIKVRATHLEADIKQACGGLQFAKGVLIRLEADIERGFGGQR